MDNSIRATYYEENELMGEEKYYIEGGLRFEKDKKYTIEDLDALPEDMRFELIDGVFYHMSSPSTVHQRLSRKLEHIINGYIIYKDGDCEMFHAPYGVMPSEDDDTTVVQPDILVVCDPGKIKPEGCIGAPDWIIEIISPSNPGHDYITKLKLYSRVGVREYWIVDPLNKSVTVYTKSDGELSTKHYSFNDTIKVGIYDDLEIDFDKLSEGL